MYFFLSFLLKDVVIDLLAFQAGLSSFTVGVEEAGVLVEKVTFFLLRR